MKKFFVYIIECLDNSYYTGYTTDLVKRFELHKLGKGAKYTRAKKAKKLVYFEEFLTKEEAMKREYEIKQFKREDKEKLIRENLNSN
jgi:putative endonuclease